MRANHRRTSVMDSVEDTRTLCSIMKQSLVQSLQVRALRL